MSDRLDVSLATVACLVTEQFPQWAGLALRPVPSPGWDNVSFRLGAELLVRLPSAEGYVAQVAKEQRWLPLLAARLPVPIPVPAGHGRPGCGYPFPWSVHRWIDGVDAIQRPPSDLTAFARSVGRFLVALRAVDPSGGPEPGPHCWYRGAPPTVYAGDVDRALAVLGERVPRQAGAAWAAAVEPEFTGPSVWFHGDVAAGNLLVEDDRLAAVIDFGTCGVGDPACDLALAWTMFESRSRATFREAAEADEGTWRRGAAWALWKALITIADDPGHTGALRTMTEVLADHANGFR